MYGCSMRITPEFSQNAGEAKIAQTCFAFVCDKNVPLERQDMLVQDISIYNCSTCVTYPANVAMNDREGMH